MRILGIDPGLRFTGWGIIDFKGNKLDHISHGVIKTNNKSSMAERLKNIFDGLTQQIEIWKPSESAIEETFVNNNPTSSLKLGQARGVAMMAAANLSLTVAEYSPNFIKKSVVGVGHAQKEQVQAMIKILLPGTEASSDAADALAVAICHAHNLQSCKILENSIM